MLNFIEITKGCAKGLLIALNILSILVALCTFGFAVVDIKILKQYGEEEAAGSYTGDVIIIVASLLLVVVAILGCVGTGRDSVKLLYLYVGFVLLMVLLELLIAIYVSVQRYGLQFRVTEWIREDFYKNVTREDQVQHVKLWDELQTAYECCGLNGPEDYVALSKHIPLSCCARAYLARTDYAQKLLYKSCVQSATYYKDGCEEEILFILRSDADWLLGVAVIIFWFEAVTYFQNGYEDISRYIFISILEAASVVLALWVSSHLKNCVQVYKNTVRY